MEVKSKNIFQKTILTAIGIGIWVLVLQNAGIISSRQNVYVQGGTIDAAVSGPVDIKNRVQVYGSVDAHIGHRIDVNLDAINNRRSFYDFGGNGNYCRIPVYTGR